MGNGASSMRYETYRPLFPLKGKVEAIEKLLALQRGFIEREHIDAILATTAHINELIRQVQTYKKVCRHNIAHTHGAAAALFRHAINDIADKVIVLQSAHKENRKMLARITEEKSLEIGKRRIALSNASFPYADRHVLIDSEV